MTGTIENNGTEPVILTLEIPKDAPSDIQMMALWVRVFGHFSNDLTDNELRAAANWFNSYLEHHTKEDEQ